MDSDRPRILQEQDKQQELEKAKWHPTKREYLAALVAGAFVDKDSNTPISDIDSVAHYAVTLADAIIVECK